MPSKQNDPIRTIGRNGLSLEAIAIAIAACTNTTAIAMEEAAAVAESRRYRRIQAAGQRSLLPRDAQAG